MTAMATGMARAMPVAIVTGGNSGIGRAAVTHLAKAGFDVGFTWHSEEERAQETLGEIEQHGHRGAAQHLDLHDLDRVAPAVGALADQLGGVDALVNNAGYGSETPFVEMSLEEFRGVIEVNLLGA